MRAEGETFELALRHASDDMGHALSGDNPGAYEDSREGALSQVSDALDLVRGKVLGLLHVLAAIEKDKSRIIVACSKGQTKSMGELVDEWAGVYIKLFELIDELCSVAENDTAIGNGMVADMAWVPFDEMAVFFIFGFRCSQCEDKAWSVLQLAGFLKNQLGKESNEALKIIMAQGGWVPFSDFWRPFLRNVFYTLEAEIRLSTYMLMHLDVQAICVDAPNGVVSGVEEEGAPAKNIERVRRLIKDNERFVVVDEA